MAGPERSQRLAVLVAMSGGVDSSVAATLLVEQGHQVVGATLKTFCYGVEAGPRRACCGLEGVQAARRVCDVLGIPHFVFDEEEGFTRSVIDDFTAEYAAGRTPNPCVECNSHAKIPTLLRRAKLLGIPALATGHYARIEGDTAGYFRILRGNDAAKDQTYFLWGLPRDILPQLLFPVGHLTKREVRAIARARELGVQNQPESQEICFVPGDYVDFLRQRLGAGHPALSPGALITATGESVGSHHGYAGYTVGQRKGLGGGGGQPRYVLEIRPDTREVIVGSFNELQRREVSLERLNWLATPPTTGERLMLQVRYRARAVAAAVTRIDEQSMDLVLEQPARAITPGQSGVLYRGDLLLGGGRII